MDKRRSVPVCAAIAFLLVLSCSNPSSPSEEPEDTAQDEAITLSISSTGGSLVFEGLGSLIIAEGSLTSPTEITFSKVKVDDAVKDALQNQRRFKVAGIDPVAGLSFSFPVPTEFEDDYIVGATLQADLATDDVAELDIEYDPSTRIVKVTIPAALQKSLLSAKGGSPTKKTSRSAKGDVGWIVVFEWEKSYTPKADEKILQIPYYKQSGGCCWGMATLMLLKSYKTEGAPPSIADLLKFAESDPEDWGITSWKFMEKVPAFLASHTNLIGKSRSYRLKSSLFARAAREIDNGHPLVLRWASHAVLVVGYTKVGDDYALVVHDSKDVNPAVEPPTDGWGGRMYTVFPMDWVSNYLTDSLNEMQLAWLDGVLPNARSLQTINMPLAGEGIDGSRIESEVGYILVGKMGLKEWGIVAQAMPYPSDASGIRWVDPLSTTKAAIATIPTSKFATDIGYELWCYNASDSDAAVTAKIRILQGNTELTADDYPTNLDKIQYFGDRDLDLAKKPLKISGSIPFIQIKDPSLADASGVMSLTVEVSLQVGDAVADGPYSIPLSISVVPLLETISSTTLSPGASFSLSGAGFGSKKYDQGVLLVDSSTKAKSYAEITSWADEKIEAKIPATQGVGSYEVYVVVGTGSRAFRSAKKDLTLAKEYTVKFEYSAGTVTDGQTLGGEVPVDSTAYKIGDMVDIKGTAESLYIIDTDGESRKYLDYWTAGGIVTKQANIVLGSDCSLVNVSKGDTNFGYTRYTVTLKIGGVDYPVAIDRLGEGYDLIMSMKAGYTAWQ